MVSLARELDSCRKIAFTLIGGVVSAITHLHLGKVKHPLQPRQ
jgi:hypothetical protein